jgi:DNA-binding transcriptional LysR family regulator
VEETHSAESADTLLGFVAAGIGFTLVPSLEPHGPKLNGVVAHRLEVPGSVFPVYAAWRRGVPHPLVQAALALAPHVEA